MRHSDAWAPSKRNLIINVRGHGHNRHDLSLRFNLSLVLSRAFKASTRINAAAREKIFETLFCDQGYYTNKLMNAVVINAIAREYFAEPEKMLRPRLALPG
jgi:hypothetical protein